MTRVSNAALLRLRNELPARRWAILKAVAELRLVSGEQLRRYFYPDPTPSAARMARRDLTAMYERGILHRLDRQIGGQRAGSSAFVWAVGAVGRRLLELERGEGLPGGRSRYEPTLGFVAHTLAVSEVWVQLHEYLRDPWTGEPNVVIDFQAERSAWRTYNDALGMPATLKPDAEVCIRRRATEDVLWLEVDRATERRATIHGKCAAVVAYFDSGSEQQTGVFPLTVWLTTDERRAQVLRDVVAEFSPRDQRLFRVGLLTAAAPLLFSIASEGSS